MAQPLRITLVDESELASVGFSTLLQPYADRVTVVANRDAIAAPDALDVVLYEPCGLTSMASSMLRDLCEVGNARTAVFSWAAPDQLPPTTSPHLDKTLTAAQLVRSIERLVEGRLEPAAPREVVRLPVVPDREEQVAATPAEAAADDVLGDVGLTPRESAIVSLIVEGMSNREISEDLGLSVNSVKTYIRSAYRKMGVERRTQAVLWALRHHAPASLVG